MTPRSRLIVAGLLCLTPWLARAEATKELFTDAGLYSGFQNIFVYNPSSPPIDQADATAPEGQRSFVIHQLNGQFSGWGIYNVTAPGGFTKSPQVYTDYAGGSLRFWLKSNFTLKVTVEIGSGGTQKP